MRAEELSDNARAILEKYQEWLNCTTYPPLEIDDFFKDDETVVLLETTEVVVLSVGYGDDGGNSVVTGFINIYVSSTPPDVVSISQYYDFHLQVIYQDGRFLS